MIPTRRLLVVFLATAPLVAFGDAGRAAASLLALFLAGVAAIDWWLARDIHRLDVRRTVEDKLSLAEWNPVTLTLTNGTGRDAGVTVRDVAPADFAVERGAAAAAGSPAPSGARSETIPVTSTGEIVRVPAQGHATVVYRVWPRRRGDYTFGDLHVRLTGPLGLVRRQRTLAGTGVAVRVYPSLKQLRRYELHVRRGIAQEAGLKAIRVPGASTEFERLREYVPDDEFRRINWKATARRGKPIVNQFEAERSQNVVVMLDSGRLMGARADLPAVDEASALVAGEAPAGLAKLDYAVNAALLLSYVAAVRGDRVALLAYADGVRRFLPPARGRHAFLRTVDALYALAPEPVEPDHALAFQFLAARSLRRSLVVLFTDLADQESSASLVANVLRAARHHLVVCVTLGDPTVTRPARALPKDSQALYEKMVAQRLLDERAAVLGTMTRRGVHTLDTDADRLSPSLVDTYLELKQRGRI